MFRLELVRMFRFRPVTVPTKTVQGCLCVCRGWINLFHEHSLLEKGMKNYSKHSKISISLFF